MEKPDSKMLRPRLEPSIWGMCAETAASQKTAVDITWQTRKELLWSFLQI
jgi:hypothetical protein